LAFVAGPIEHQDIEQLHVFTEELVLVASPSVSSLKDLAHIADLKTVVFQFGCSYRQRLEAFLYGRGLIVARPLEFGSLDAILSCVAAGVGVTLLPLGVAEQAAAAGKVSVHRMPPDLARVQTLFVRRREGYVSSALGAFLEMAKAVQGERNERRPPKVASGVSREATAAPRPFASIK
jgi:LysR family transcriptional regulator, cell division regulator